MEQKNIRIFFAILPLLMLAFSGLASADVNDSPSWNYTLAFTGPSGYLIQFNEVPASVHIGTFPTKHVQFSWAKGYALGLLELHKLYVGQIAQEIPGFDARPMQDLVLVENGILVANLSTGEISKISAMPFVKQVYELGYEWPAMPSVTQITGAADMWAGGYSGAGVRVGVVDTGIDATHPDFAVPSCNANGSVGPGCRVEWAYDFVYNHDRPAPSYGGHGTHVAGIVAANSTSTNGTLFRGMAPDATLYDYKVCDWNVLTVSPAPANSCPETSILGAFERVLDPNNDSDMSDHMDVATMSIGALDNDPNSIVSLAADNMVNVGVVSVAAVHNYGAGSASGATPNYGYVASPGASRKTIGVGATSKQDVMASFSSHGPVLGGAVKPDVVAEGVLVCSTFWTGNGNSSCYGFPGHISHSGTSMSTPVVAGAVALLRQQHPDWNPDEIKYALRNTARNNVTKSINSVRYPANVLEEGHGRISVLAAGASLRPIIVEIAKAYETHGAVQFNASIIGYGNDTAGAYTYTYDLGYMGQNPRMNGPQISDPAAWIPEYHSQGQVQLVNGTQSQLLFAPINKSAMFPINGLFLVRLNVSGNGRETLDYFTFIVDNPAVLTPFNGDVYGASFDINGSVQLPANYTYAVIYAPSGSQDWTNAGITLENNGQQSADGRIARFVAPAGLQSGFYMFRLGMYDSNGIGQSIEATFATVRIDKGIAPQFPAYLTIPVPSYDHRWSYRSEAYNYEMDSYFIVPSITDAANGQKELIYAESLPDRRASSVYAITANGAVSNITSSPAGTEGEVNRLSLHSYDYNGDGAADYSYAKYAAADHHSVFAQQQGGMPLWSLYSNQTQPPAMYQYYRMQYQLNSYEVLADLDHDGMKELAFVLPGNLTASVYVLEANGSVRQGWPQNVSHGVSSESVQRSPAAGRFGPGQELGIAYAGFSECYYVDGCSMPYGKAYMFYANGSMMPGWPVYFDAYYANPFPSPVAADMNGDGIDELLLSAGYGIREYNSSGAVVQTMLPNATFDTSPVVADIDNDGMPDVAIEETNGLVHLLYANGTEHAGWPVQNQRSSLVGASWLGSYAIYEPILADADGDGTLDLIYEGREGVGGIPFNTIHARNIAGAELAGFPKYAEAGLVAGLNAADLDNDGTLELVGTGEGRQRISWFDNLRIGSNYSTNTVPRQTVYVWHLGAPITQMDKAWPTQRGNYDRTGRAVLRLGAPYSFGAQGTMDGNITASWAEADAYMSLSSYVVQLANDSNFTQIVSQAILPLTARNYIFQNAAQGTYYVRAGSRSTNGSMAWAAPIMAGSGALDVNNPYGGDVYRDSLNVTGSISLPAGSTYTIEYAPVGTENWDSAGISLANNGMQSVTNGTLAAFSAPQGFNTDFYKFRLSVRNPQGMAYYAKQLAIVRMDMGLRQNFPFMAPSTSQDYPMPVIKNVGGSAAKEILFASRGPAGNSTSLYVVGANGMLVNNFASGLEQYPNLNRLSLQVTSGSNGALEAIYSKGGIAAGSASQAAALAMNGNSLWNRNFTTGGATYQLGSFTLAADLNHDGNKELVFMVQGAGQTRSIYVTDMNGNIMNGWPKNVTECGPRVGMQVNPIVAKLDSGTQLAIVYAGDGDNCNAPSGKAYAFRLNGSSFAGWPVTYGSPTWARPASADLNNGGTDEVIIPTRDGIYAFGGNGTQLWHSLAGQFVEAPAIGMQSANRSLMIATSATMTQHGIRVLDAQGQQIGSWQTSSDDYMGPLLVDANGDGAMDVAYTDTENVSGTLFGSLHMRDISGNDVVPPKYVELLTAGLQGKSIADLDGDGSLELVSGSEGAQRYGANASIAKRQSLYAWTLANATDNALNRGWPAFSHNFERTGRLVTRMGAPYSLGTAVSGSTLTISFVAADDSPYLTGYAIQESINPDFANASVQEVPSAGNYQVSGLANGWHYVRAASVNALAMPPDQRYVWTAAKQVCIGSQLNCPDRPVQIVNIGSVRRIDTGTRIANAIGPIAIGIDQNMSRMQGDNSTLNISNVSEVQEILVDGG